MWNDVELLDTRFGEGDAVRVLGRVEKFRDRLQLDVRTLEPAPDADPAAMAPAMRRDADELEGFLEFLVAEITHPGLHDAVERVLDTETRAAMRALPATLDGHHSYAGGLLEHTVGVATLCRETAQLHQRLRIDLLLAAALVHDVGRTRELGRGPVFRPTDEGRLLGHVHLGLRLIEERAPVARSRRARGAAARGVLPSRRSRRPHGGGGGALPREPARRRRGDETRQRLTGILLALAASLSWGVADFGAGVASRRLPVPLVIAATQAAGLVVHRDRRRDRPSRAADRERSSRGARSPVSSASSA